MDRINQVQVNRDEQGFWTHPDFPAWDEDTASDEMNAWLAANGINFKAIWFHDDAPESLLESWFEGNDAAACAQWQPTFNPESGFLLSIHDTEDGPIALFATFIEQPDKLS